MKKSRPKKKVVRRIKKDKFCYFCKNKETVSFWQSAKLAEYLSVRGRIMGRDQSGLCAKHQRILAREIKRGRHLALLPFVISG